MHSLTIAYGRKGGPRSGHIREGRQGVANPAFAVRAGETPPLRLNTDHGLRFPPEQLAQLPGNREKLDYLRHEIAGALDLFAPHQRSFLDRYFAFITEQCRHAAPALAERVEWSGGLFAADDFMFSALWPLPDATVTLSDGRGDAALGPFDFAFWDGRRVIAVTLSSRPQRADNAGETSGRPGAGHVLPVTIIANELAREPGPFTTPRFPDEFVFFWRGERVPSSPFRPEGLTPPGVAAAQRQETGHG